MNHSLHSLLPILHRLAICGMLLVYAVSAAPYSQAASLPLASPSTHCPSLPAPSGRIVNVSSPQELWNASNEGIPHTTILIADGVYHLGQNGYYLWLDTPHITLRSASGNRQAVILDDEYAASEVITILASNITIADLTVRRAATHPIHITTSNDADTLNTLIYNVHIIDPGQQGIKINPNSARTHFTDDGEIACSRIELTDAGRSQVWQINGSCYTGGVDAHQSRGWKIRDNEIEGFWCPQDLSEHAVHFWTGSRDTLVERNVLLDNARGVGFGLQENGSGRIYDDNPCPSASGYVDHYEGIIRNNFIFASRGELFASEAGFDCGICLWQACGIQAVHNTVFTAQTPASSSIEWRFDNTQAQIANNLTSHNLVDRGGTAVLQSNLSSAQASLFVNAANGDLHLQTSAADAIDRGSTLTPGLCSDDIDGDPRPYAAAPDLGADEISSPLPEQPYHLWLPLIQSASP